MKLFKNKRVVMATSLLIGVLMLSIPTFAQINQKTGYDKFKDSIKTTADTLCSNSDSFTGEMSLTVKDNDKVVLKTTTLSRIDNKNNAQENTETTANGDLEQKDYYYRDSKQSISLNSKTNEYHVIEYTSPMTNNVKERNPFDDENASDIEKIFDAAVAGLKDNVVSEVKNDGSIAFSGNITENQVPAIVNTISSYAFKTQINSEFHNAAGMPLLTKDIYIKNVSGKAEADKNGVLENVFATFVMSGKEKNGTSHDLSIDILFNVSDINKTVVNPPDLSGKNVQKSVSKGDFQTADPKMYSGQYKNDIVAVIDGKFVKVGERIVTIAHADSGMLEGNYHEEYLKEYAGKYTAADFTFAAKASTDKNDNTRHFVIAGSDDKDDGSIYLQDNGNISFYSNSAQKYRTDLYNGDFTRIYN